MTDETITIKRSEFRNAMTIMAQEILQELGVKPKIINPEWITKNEAVKISPKRLGRKKLDNALRSGLIRKQLRTNNDNPRAPIYVSRIDCEKLIQNPRS